MKQYRHTLTDFGNTYNPALAVIRALGYALRLEKHEDYDQWVAVKNDCQISAHNPLSLLGLVSVWEQFGEQWNEPRDSILDELYDSVVE
jgi:hypothetical protein